VKNSSKRKFLGKIPKCVFFNIGNLQFLIRYLVGQKSGAKKKETLLKSVF
jgi:hypothetical protein